MLPLKLKFGIDPSLRWGDALNIQQESPLERWPKFGNIINPEIAIIAACNIVIFGKLRQSCDRITAYIRSNNQPHLCIGHPRHEPVWPAP